MDWVRLHMATRIQFGARAAICPRPNFARVDEQPLQCAYPAITRWRKNPWLRRRLELGPEQRDFPVLAEFYAAGATDYVCLSFQFGVTGDPSHGTGVLYSFTTDRPGGFRTAEIDLLRSTLPGLSLAMKAHTGHDIASGLLRTYLGSDAGSRVHSGAVERGTVDGLRSVLWYADLRGFTRISDVSSGAAIVDMLNDTFEILTAALRSRGGHVLKFIGDALLATISFDEPDEKATCRRALDAAVEPSAKVKIRNLEREARHTCPLPTLISLCTLAKCCTATLARWTGLTLR